jgi:hypothetical protein
MPELLNGRLATPIVRAHERLQAQRHADRMARGCVVCGAATPGRVCPDCYVCRACSAERGMHCTECKPPARR